MIGLRTLVLNASYLPINMVPIRTIPVEDAMTRVFNGTCHVVTEYNRKIKSQSCDIKWPAVIARNDSKHINVSVRLSREALYYRDHGICMYCEKPLESPKAVTYDHYIAKKHGGPKTWENIVASCSKCNSLKGDSKPIGIWKPKHKPFRPNYYQLLANRKKFPVIIDHESWQLFMGDWNSDVILREI